MAANSELEYLAVFLDEVTTSLTVSQYKLKKNLANIAGEKKCLIEPGTILSVDGSFSKKRYKVKLGLETEENMTSILNEIIEGCKLYNNTRAGLTSVNVMCNIKFAYSNKAWVSSKGRWEYDIHLDVVWATS